jgi:hypothetical protein
MEEPKKLIKFTPVPVRHRNDGWTAERQYAFIEALAETGVVEEACRRVGMSRTSADNLRRRPCGVHFRRAWQAAVDYGLYRLEESAHRRGREGVVRPIFHKGEQVGEYRHFDERLAMFLLRARRPDRYGGWIGTIPAPDEWEDETGDPALRLDGYLTQIDARSDIEDGGDEDDGAENNARPTTLPASARDGA